MVVEAVKKAKVGHGYDAELDEYGDMFKKGIIDPAKVTRSALGERRQHCGLGLDDRIVAHRSAGEGCADAGGAPDGFLDSTRIAKRAGDLPGPFFSDGTRLPWPRPFFVAAIGGRLASIVAGRAERAGCGCGYLSRSTK